LFGTLWPAIPYRKRGDFVLGVSFSRGGIFVRSRRRVSDQTVLHSVLVSRNVIGTSSSAALSHSSNWRANFRSTADRLQTKTTSRSPLYTIVFVRTWSNFHQL